MSPNRFDQASRYAAKLDAVGFLCWLLREDVAELRFRLWLDTRMLPFPGDPERTCDTVAWLGDADPAVEWAVPVEFCLEPDGELFGRFLVYLGQLWLEKRPTDAGGERFAVGAVVVNLTGRSRTSRNMSLRQTGVRTNLEVVERNLCDEDAAALLDAIAAGQASRCLLPWIPLMQGGEEASIIQRWIELASQETDSRRRGDYGGLALVFAEAAKRLPMWKDALKEWNVIESQQVLEWINMGRAEGEAKGEARGRIEGKVEGEIESLLRVLARRFPPGATPEMEVAIRGTVDLECLGSWLDLAVTTLSLDAFRQAAGL
ncbi:MAG TPA: hypothetical protein VH682_21270 [Gemmataceae bacterium]|jgi:hypothetical protein